MIYKGKEVAFPATTQIGFFKVIAALEQQAEDTDANLAAFASKLLDDCRPYPELITGISKEDFEKYHDIIQRLCRTLFPDALLGNEIKGIIPPFEFKLFYLSSRLRSIMEGAENELGFELNNYTEDQLYVYGCAAILGLYYNFPIPTGMPTLVDIVHKQSGITRTYRMGLNGDLLEIIPTDKSVKLTKDDFLELMDDYDNIELWKQKFPPNSWIIRGIGIVNMLDISFDHSLATITSDLLLNTPDSFENIMASMKILFNLPTLRVGFMMYEDGIFYAAHQRGMVNFILSGHKKMVAKEGFCGPSYELVIEQNKPLVITDVARFNKHSCSQVSQLLHKQPIGSYILAPIKKDDKFLGFLELAAEHTYELNAGSLEKLHALMPIISMALNRIKVETQNRREAIIQEECTTIHPSVKWRFEEEANKFMLREANDEQPIFHDIVFKHVYPLYGQLDIKSSSEKRASAVQADLARQLQLVTHLLEEAIRKTRLPIYEELFYRLNAFKKEVSQHFVSGSEYKVAYFMEHDLHPILRQLKRHSRGLEAMVNSYFEALHPDTNSIYDLRKNYDHSINVINQHLAAYLDKKQVEAQQMFPHYFERYKTDGVEYNIYVGQSISRNKHFDTIYLHNLQLWQLMITCEMEQKFAEIKAGLDFDLEIASLILVYNTALSIQFRMDEKRFDVDGAYNARYEIVKKRIDKAHIIGTTERVTSPGKIAIIYTSEQDARIYERYIAFLQNKGYLKKNSLEMLDLEDLPGITGLKALRVAVNYSNPQKNSEQYDVNVILEGLQNG